MHSFRFELITPVHDDRPVYVAGNFCDWYPDLESFRLIPTGLGRYELTIPVGTNLPDMLEYKYTRGGWDQVELDSAGEVPPNRTARPEAGACQDVVPHWRWFGRSYNPDYLPRLGMLETVSMPLLHRTRRVRVLIPHDYDDTDQRYPVLYLQDGQNLIGAGSEYGSWEIDRRLAVLASRHHHGLIVVAIDHGGQNRLGEFTTERSLAGMGEGKDYLYFLVHTLKPMIDARFRTQPDAAHTGIGGSSLGGLISLEAGLMYPAVFGRMLIFSPSLWIARTLFGRVARRPVPAGSRWYVYGGKQESKGMVPGINRFVEALRKVPHQSPPDIHVTINPNGTHSESCWGHEFPKAVDWLF